MSTTLFATINHNRHNTSFVRIAGYAFVLTILVGNALISTAVADTSCHPLETSTTATLTSQDSWSYSLAVAQPGLTATLEFYSPVVGTIDLGAGGNLNYSTCNQCMRLFQEAVGEVPAKQFFQDRGLLELSVAPGADPLPVGFKNLRLVEVTIDEAFQSIPVPGGECYEGTDAVFANGFEL